jgi:hypothetical protein
VDCQKISGIPRIIVEALKEFGADDPRAGSVKDANGFSCQMDRGADALDQRIQ